MCVYLTKLSVYEEVTVQERRFVLVHAGLECFSPARAMEEYDPEELLF